MFDTLITCLRALCGIMLLLNAYLFSLTLMKTRDNRNIRRRNIRVLRAFSSSKFSTISNILIPIYNAITSYPFQASFFGRNYYGKKIDRFSKLVKFLPEKGGRTKIAIGSIASISASLSALPLVWIDIGFLCLVILPALISITNLCHIFKSREHVVFRMFANPERFLIWFVPLYIYVISFAPHHLISTDYTRLIILLISNFYFLTFAINYFLYSVAIFSFLVITGRERKFNRVYISTYGAVNGFSFGIAFSLFISIIFYYIGEEHLFSDGELLDHKFLLLNMAIDGICFGTAGAISNAPRSPSFLFGVLNSLALVLSSILGSLACSLFLFSQNFDFSILGLSLSLTFGADLISEGIDGEIIIFLSKEFLIVHSSFLTSLIIFFIGFFTISVVSINFFLLIISATTLKKERVRDIVTFSGMIWF